MLESEGNEEQPIGVEDCVLLENYNDPTCFVKNLNLRYSADLIYTNIGPVLISINPYKSLHIYNDEYIYKYKEAAIEDPQMPPHIYSLAEMACRNMRNESVNACILVSGESGAGKTESTKYILDYIATVSTKTTNSGNSNSGMEKIKKTLIKSNHILEAFGNAKTTRNDNSSRFGKYMDIQFDFKCSPIAGHINNYLLEKSRIIYQAEGERNFHIFYQMLAGLDEDQLENDYGLLRDPNKYSYLTNKGSDGHKNKENGSEHTQAESLKDKINFKLMFEALETCQIDQNNRKDLLKIVASILHLGNIQFDKNSGQNGQNEFKISADEDSQKALKYFCLLLDLSQNEVEKALTNKKLRVLAVEDVESPLSVDQANYARNSFAKNIYERLFDWIINIVNQAMRPADPKDENNGNSLGILDIYGFEIFEQNSFEQLCINYCNEKLHQLFIEQTLKLEQEEYAQEEIPWEHVEYTENKEICSLIEGRPIGIIDILDEECSRPGKADDQTLLEKLNATFGDHSHYEVRTMLTLTQAMNLSISLDHNENSFSIKHYAGYVDYHVPGLINKNTNHLYRNFFELMLTSKNTIITQCYDDSELKDIKKNQTVGSQFRSGLKKLMSTLYSKESYYIRCIKPNKTKTQDFFDCSTVRHQVNYLSLMESLRIRRAGYAYRRSYEAFLQKYKLTCPKTWPNFKEGNAQQAVRVLLEHFHMNNQKTVTFGKTKVFIRSVKTINTLEANLAIKKIKLFTMIKANWLCYVQREKYRRKKRAVNKMKRNFRERKKGKKVEVIRTFVNGFIHRHEPYSDQNKLFLSTIYKKFLYKLAAKLSKNVKDELGWPTVSPFLKETSLYLHHLHKLHAALVYRKKLTPERLELMREKILASDLFLDKKENYAISVAMPFQLDRIYNSPYLTCLPEARQEQINQFQLVANPEDENIKYKNIVEKYNRRGYKQQTRIIVITDKQIYGYDLVTLQLRDQINLKHITSVSVTKYSDGFIIIHVAKPDKDLGYVKGDLIVRVNEYSIEFLTKLCDAIKPKDKKELLKIIDKNPEEYFLEHRLANGRSKQIEFKRSSSETNLSSNKGQYKDKKTGRLVVEV